MGVGEMVLMGFGGLGTLLGGGGIWTWLDGAAKRRADKEAEAERAAASIGTSQADLAQALTAHTAELVSEMRKERIGLRREVNGQRRELRGLKSAVADCHANHGECERALAAVRAEVDELMRRHPPASY